MRKLIAVIMMMVAMSNVAFGAAIGEYEKMRILEGTYEVCDKYPSVKGLNTDTWTEVDAFGNQYRIYSYMESGKQKLVCLKHHVSRQERKALKAAKKADK